ncbi:heavy metal translocating P-type ATPase [Methanobrevibacter curvatus]|uniref:Copper-exporting P-type ATPase A n=1 Tax=Methanobrevibacter curvatus TaxID=49547 RepID=A0A165YXV1_9EURY|nr:heavy metal translocating P-type ATPase [Methanobrevibacter curvatus]KZX09999.1 copper-exporting P-type ATPase A [Methanobrevibacter curvatus]
MNNKLKNIEIKIVGMHCAVCASNVEKSLKSLDGVLNASVNISSNNAVVEYNDKLVSFEKINKAIESLGFDVVFDEVQLQIDGMHCAVCVANIEKVLNGLNGVKKAIVNLSLQRVHVFYNKNLVSIKDMGEAIESLGFDYIGVAEEIDLSADDERFRKDLKDKRNRIIVGFISSAVLMAIMYLPIENLVSIPFSHHMSMDIHIIGILSLLISIGPFIYVSKPILDGGYKSISHKILDMDVMYSMGILVAFISSTLGTFNIVLDSHFMFYETAIMLASFLSLGRYLESRAKNQTLNSIKQLIGLQPKTATLLIENKEEELDLSKEFDGKNNEIDSFNEKYFEKTIFIEEIAIGDILLVKPGEKIPADGIVINGDSYVDESMISGEPIPKHKNKEKNKVFSGTINQNGILYIKSIKVGRETLLSQIIDLVSKAQGSKPPVQSLADKVVKFFIPTVFIIAILSGLFWYLFNGDKLFALSTVISVLVIACPCALGLATPTAVTVGVGRAAEYGVLIKNGEVLENAGKTKIAIFDKTGTITEGKPEISDIYPVDDNLKFYYPIFIKNQRIMENSNLDSSLNSSLDSSLGSSLDSNLNSNDLNDFLLMITGSLESKSNHPIAKTIVKECQNLKINLFDLDSFENISGKGLKAIYKNKQIIVGNKKILDDENIKISDDLLERYLKLSNEGKTTILIAIENDVLGIIALMDKIKDNAKYTMDSLKSLDIEPMMITGDNNKTAIEVGKKVGIENIISEVLPNEKLDHLINIKTKFSNSIKKDNGNNIIITFVGDGINDAPAISGADVGIALGSGSDIAMDSGDIVLTDDNLENVVVAIEFSKKVIRRIKENIFWAFAYNMILIPIACGILYPIFGIVFRPEYGALAMALSSVTVISLSLLLKNFKPKIKKDENKTY